MPKKVDLRTARFLRGKTQVDLEKNARVNQSKVSKFEKHGIQCLTIDEKKRLEDFLGIPIAWHSTRNDGFDQSELTADEKAEIQPFVNFLMLKANPQQVLEWLSAYETGREAYKAVKQAMEQFPFMIPMPEINWKKGGI